MMTWQLAITRYRKWMRLADKSPNTLVTYTHYLNFMADHLDTDDPWDVTLEDLEDLMDEVPGPSARKSLRSVLSGFYRWGHRRGYIAYDPTVELPSPKVRYGIARPMPEEYIDDALTRATDRERLMLDLGANHGLRAGEMSRVGSSDLEPGGSLIVHGKGAKDRRVPIKSPELARAIRAADGWLFPNDQRGGHITPNHVSHLLSALFPDGWTGHQLRHRFATVTFKITRDIEAVSRLLGHESSEVTRRYVAIDDQDLGAVVEAAQIDMYPERLAA